MKILHIVSALLGVYLLAGCGSGEEATKAEMNAGVNSKQPAAGAKQQAQDMMAAGANAAKQHELDWAKAHPDKVAEVNAQRAKVGKPPLGQ